MRAVRLKRAMKLAAIVFTSLLSVGHAASGVANGPGTTPLRFELIGAAGGLPDIVSRALSPYLFASIGVPVIIEDRPGAGGNIAAAFVARAQPDGHALLVTGSNQAVNPTLLPNPGFDYARDLALAAMTVSTKMLLVAAPAFPAKTDVIAIAKQKPKSVSMAIPDDRFAQSPRDGKLEKFLRSEARRFSNLLKHSRVVKPPQ